MNKPTHDSSDEMIIQTPNREIKLSRRAVDEAWNKIVYHNFTTAELNKAFKKARDKVENIPVEKLIAYWFSTREIEYLEQKVFGFTRGYSFASCYIDRLEQALGVDQQSSDLEKAYFKLKLKEMVLIGKELSDFDYRDFKSFIANAQPLNPEVLRKLEFYGFKSYDFLKIKKELLPHLGQIISEIEEIYGIPSRLSEETKAQVKDHLMQELNIQKESTII